MPTLVVRAHMGRGVVVYMGRGVVVYMGRGRGCCLLQQSTVDTSLYKVYKIL